MRTIIQFVQTESKDSTKKLAIQKLQKLHEKFDWIIRAEVFFKTSNTSEPTNKICEIKLSVPGPRIYAESCESTFEAALAETISDLEVQLKKNKSKTADHL